MKRRPFNLLTLLSLLLCVAICVLWVRSFFVFDAISWQGQRGAKVINAAVASDSGGAHFGLTVIDFSDAFPGTPAEWMGGMWSPGWQRFVDVPTGKWRERFGHGGTDSTIRAATISRRRTVGISKSPTGSRSS